METVGLNSNSGVYFYIINNGGKLTLLVVPEHYSDSSFIDLHSGQSAQGLGYDVKTIGTDIIYCINDDRITIIDVNEKKLLADNLKCKGYRKDGVLWGYVVIKEDGTKSFWPTGNSHRVFPIGEITSELAKEIFAISISSIFYDNSKANGAHGAIGLVYDGGTAFYNPEMVFLDTEMHNNRVFIERLFDKGYVIVRELREENGITNNWAYYIYHFEQWDTSFKRYNMCCTPVGYEQIITIPREWCTWDCASEINKVWGFIAVKEFNSDKIKVIAIAADSRGIARDTLGLKISGASFESAGDEVLGIRPLANVFVDSDGYYNSLWNRYDKKAYFLERASDMCRIIEFKIANNWYNDNSENTQNIIMNFPSKYLKKTPNSFVAHPLGENSSGMCSLVYVDKESDKIKMQFIINDSISASIDGKLAEMNGKLFDEILMYKKFIILRGDGECAVYSAKTFKKLHVFSIGVKIYQLPNGRLEFEEPDGQIYSSFNFSAKDGDCGIINGESSYVSGTKTWRKKCTVRYINGKVHYSAVYYTKDGENLICESEFRKFTLWCNECESPVKNHGLGTNSLVRFLKKPTLDAKRTKFFKKA